MSRSLLKLVITGGRTYTDVKFVAEVMEHYRKRAKDMMATLVVIQGGAQGADTLVRNWCKREGVPVLTLDAQWEYYGNPAGPIRNGWMIEFFDPTHGFVFPGDQGTNDMHTKMKAAGLIVLTHEEFTKTCKTSKRPTLKKPSRSAGATT